MAKYIYPAVFEKENEGGYSVYFPDLKGANTCGDTLEDAYNMAADCLGGLLLAYGDKKPEASNMANFENSEDSFVTLISVDLKAYEYSLKTKPIKKTLYIPKELNDKAEALGVNFSELLRQALKKELNG